MEIVRGDLIEEGESVLIYHGLFRGRAVRLYYQIKGKETLSHEIRLYLELQEMVNVPTMILFSTEEDNVNGVETSALLVTEPLVGVVLTQCPLRGMGAMPLVLNLIAEIDSLHQAGIVHGDLLPGSVLVQGEQVLLHGMYASYSIDRVRYPPSYCDCDSSDDEDPLTPQGELPLFRREEGDWEMVAIMARFLILDQEWEEACLSVFGKVRFSNADEMRAYVANLTL
jgi:hypothetical protein